MSEQPPLTDLQKIDNQTDAINKAQASVNYVPPVVNSLLGGFDPENVNPWMQKYNNLYSQQSQPNEFFGNLYPSFLPGTSSDPIANKDLFTAQLHMNTIAGSLIGQLQSYGEYYKGPSPVANNSFTGNAADFILKNKDEILKQPAGDTIIGNALQGKYRVFNNDPERLLWQMSYDAAKHDYEQRIGLASTTDNIVTGLISSAPEMLATSFIPGGGIPGFAKGAFGAGKLASEAGILTGRGLGAVKLATATGEAAARNITTGILKAYGSEMAAGAINLGAYGAARELTWQALNNDRSGLESVNRIIGDMITGASIGIASKALGSIAGRFFSQAELEAAIKKNENPPEPPTSSLVKTGVDPDKPLLFPRDAEGNYISEPQQKIFDAQGNEIPTIKAQNVKVTDSAPVVKPTLTPEDIIKGRPTEFRPENVRAGLTPEEISHIEKSQNDIESRINETYKTDQAIKFANDLNEIRNNADALIKKNEIPFDDPAHIALRDIVGEIDRINDSEFTTNAGSGGPDIRNNIQEMKNFIRSFEQGEDPLKGTLNPQVDNLINDFRKVIAKREQVINGFERELAKRSRIESSKFEVDYLREKFNKSNSAADNLFDQVTNRSSERQPLISGGPEILTQVNDGLRSLEQQALEWRIREATKGDREAAKAENVRLNSKVDALNQGLKDIKKAVNDLPTADDAAKAADKASTISTLRNGLILGPTFSPELRGIALNLLGTTPLGSTGQPYVAAKHNFIPDQDIKQVYQEAVNLLLSLPKSETVNNLLNRQQIIDHMKYPDLGQMEKLINDISRETASIITKSDYYNKNNITIVKALGLSNALDSGSLAIAHSLVKMETAANRAIQFYGEGQLSHLGDILKNDVGEVYPDHDINANLDYIYNQVANKLADNAKVVWTNIFNDYFAPLSRVDSSRILGSGENSHMILDAAKTILINKMQNANNEDVANVIKGHVAESILSDVNSINGVEHRPIYSSLDAEKDYILNMLKAAISDNLLISRDKTTVRNAIHMNLMNRAESLQKVMDIIYPTGKPLNNTTPNFSITNKPTQSTIDDNLPEENKAGLRSSDEDFQKSMNELMTKALNIERVKDLVIPPIISKDSSGKKLDNQIIMDLHPGILPDGNLMDMRLDQVIRKNMENNK